MNFNFTRNLQKLEEYSLSMIDLFDSLPASFFDDPSLEPSKKVVEQILNESKKDSNHTTQDTSSLFYYFFN